MRSGVWPTFIAAVQAAISVLFTILWGVVAGYLELVDDHSAQKLSELCVGLLLPALLVTNIGSELNPENAIQYSAIIAWSLIYTVLTLALSLWLKRAFKLPAWTVVATTFNSNTSMPLLLTQTLAATGIIDGLLISDSDTVAAAVNRARSYFLANALCGNVLTFAIGPKMFQKPIHRHHNPSEEEFEPEDDEPREPRDGALLSPANEGISLLHGPTMPHDNRGHYKLPVLGRRAFHELPPPLRAVWSFLYSICNPVLLGGLVAGVLGLVPFLHRAFFNSSQEGGIFNAWFVTSIETIGQLFVGLQTLIVGERLSRSIRRMARGESSGHIPWTGAIFTLLVRYVVWPLSSLALIAYIYSRTSLLSGDPMLPFAMMLMPCGPSAMKLTALADVSGAAPEEKLSLAKFLTLSYALSPLLAFAVAGSFKVTEAITGRA